MRVSSDRLFPSVHGDDEDFSRSPVQRIMARFAAGAAAFFMVIFLVIGESQAAMSADAVNPGNVLGTASISLTSNQPATAMFNVPTMTHGQTVSRCILVTYTGPAAPNQAVSLQATDLTTTGTLDQHITLSVERDPGANPTADPDCANFGTPPVDTGYSRTLAAAAANPADIWTLTATSQGSDSWTTTAAFRITATVAPTATSGESATFNLRFATEY